MTTTVDTDTLELSALDVTAIRMADSVTFQVHDGRAYLRAIKRDPTKGDTYSAREQRAFPGTGRFDTDRDREISATFDAYGYSVDGCHTWAHETAPNLSAFHMIHSAQYREEWRTIADLIRQGGRLHLSWIADNNNQVIKAASLHADMLRLVIKRGDKHMVFLIAHNVGPDNTARMIKRNGY